MVDQPRDFRVLVACGLLSFFCSTLGRHFGKVKMHRSISAFFLNLSVVEKHRRLSNYMVRSVLQEGMFAQFAVGLHTWARMCVQNKQSSQRQRSTVIRMSETGYILRNSAIRHVSGAKNLQHDNQFIIRKRDRNLMPAKTSLVRTL